MGHYLTLAQLDAEQSVDWSHDDTEEVEGYVDRMLNYMLPGEYERNRKDISIAVYANLQHLREAMKACVREGKRSAKQNLKQEIDRFEALVVEANKPVAHQHSFVYWDVESYHAVFCTSCGKGFKLSIDQEFYADGSKIKPK